LRARAFKNFSAMGIEPRRLRRFGSEFLIDFARLNRHLEYNGSLEPQVEEPLWAAKSILFELEVDEVAVYYPAICENWFQITDHSLKRLRQMELRRLSSGRILNYEDFF
jgi:hypothetical protein